MRKFKWAAVAAVVMLVGCGQEQLPEISTGPPPATVDTLSLGGLPKVFTGEHEWVRRTTASTAEAAGVAAALADQGYVLAPEHSLVAPLNHGDLTLQTFVGVDDMVLVLHQQSRRRQMAAYRISRDIAGVVGTPVIVEPASHLLSQSARFSETQWDVFFTCVYDNLGETFIDCAQTCYSSQVFWCVLPCVVPRLPGILYQCLYQAFSPKVLRQD